MTRCFENTTCLQLSGVRKFIIFLMESSNFLSLLPIIFLNVWDVYQAELSHDTTLAAATVCAVFQPRPKK